MKAATAKTAVGFRNILFATDFSPAAAQAVPYVKRIAKHYDADVVALYVRPPVVNPMMESATWPIDVEAANAQGEFETWPIEAIKKIVKPQAWWIYEKLAYKTPDFAVLAHAG